MTVLGLFGFDGPASIDELRQGGMRRYVRRRVVAAVAPSGALLVAALLLGARRLNGALVEPPSFAAAAGCAVVILALGWISSLVVRRSFAATDVQLPTIWMIALDLAAPVRGAAAVVWGAAMSLPGISAVAAVALWSPIVVMAAGWMLRLVRPTSFFVPDPPGACRSWSEPGEAGAVDPSIAPRAPGSSSPADAFPAEDESLAATDRLTSSMERRETVAGGEVIEGYATVEFAPGARSAAAHLAFCPPLKTGDPVVSVAVEDDLEAEVKVTQALRYAARFDVRLPTPAEEHFAIRLRYRVTSA